MENLYVVYNIFMKLWEKVRLKKTKELIKMNFERKWN